MNREEALIVGELYHVYNRGNHKERIFFGESDYLFFIRRMISYAERYNVSIVMFVLMPNHYHFILSQKKTGGISSMMGTLATSFAKRQNILRNRSGHLFQGPFHYKRITSDEYLIGLARYIHLNPVKAGLARDPAEWTWTSYRIDCLNRPTSFEGLGFRENQLLEEVHDFTPVLEIFEMEREGYVQFLDDLKNAMISAWDEEIWG